MEGVRKLKRADVTQMLRTRNADMRPSAADLPSRVPRFHFPHLIRHRPPNTKNTTRYNTKREVVPHWAPAHQSIPPLTRIPKPPDRLPGSAPPVAVVARGKQCGCPGLLLTSTAPIPRGPWRIPRCPDCGARVPGIARNCQRACQAIGRQGVLARSHATVNAVDGFCFYLMRSAGLPRVKGPPCSIQTDVLSESRTICFIHARARTDCGSLDDFLERTYAATLAQVRVVFL